MRNLLLIIVVILVGTGCSNQSGITKRKYRSGYHVSFLKQQTDLHSIKSEIKAKVLNSDSSKTNPKDAFVILNNGDTIEARVEAIYDDEISYRKLNNLDGPLYRKKTSLIKKVVSQSGELFYGEEEVEQPLSDWKVITKNGDTIRAIIKSIDENEVLYKKVSNPDGPSYFREIEEIDKILDEHGNEAYTEYFNNSQPALKEWGESEANDSASPAESPNEDDYYSGDAVQPTVYDNEKERLVTDPDAVATFIFGTISLALTILGAAGITMGAIWLNGGNWNMEVWAIFAIWFGVVAAIQALITGIAAFVTGLTSTIKTRSKNSRYREDWRSIYGLAIGGLWVLGILASFAALFIFA